MNYSSGYEECVKPEYLEMLRTFSHYYESLDSRIRFSGSDCYWLPSPEALLRIRIGLLMGFY